MSDLIRTEVQDGVAVLTIDNPPVNALGPGVPESLMDAITQAGQDQAVRAIVLTGTGKTFTAGADIHQLQEATRNPENAPEMHPLLARIEDSNKPVVIALNGMALGGGLELALAGHYRVAASGILIGAPEVNLGIIPGAEGTQRLPRVVGVEAAVNLCVSGRPIPAEEALKLGLVDRVLKGDFEAEAAAFAREIADQPFRMTRERTDKMPPHADNTKAFEGGMALAQKFRKNQIAPLRVIEAIEAATVLPFAEGCIRERQIAKECLASPQAQAMIHVFFAERAVSKVPGIAKDTPTYTIARAAIIGAGIMGSGIATACINAGIDALLTDTSQEALDRGMQAIRKNYDGQIKKGRITPEQVEGRLAKVTPQLGYDGFDQVDLILEAALETMDVKQQIFREIDKLAKPDCVLATNTSTLDLDAIAGVTSRPEMVIGMHFFSPAHVMRLLEIVRGKATSNEVIATALALAKRLKKIGVVVGNGFGFAGNRMMFPYMREAQFLVEEGASPQQVDAALTGFGMAMGILAVDDMGGLDLLYRVRQEHKDILLPEGVRNPRIHDALFHAGRWGQKRGAGWYKYDGSHKPIPDPEIEPIIEKVAREAGIQRRTIQDQEIVERCLFAMINEGARVLEDGIAARAADIDVIYCTGYGFPTYRGGPMWYASSVGLANVVHRIHELADQFGAELWTPAPLLARLAEQGKSFEDFDNERAD